MHLRRLKAKDAEYMLEWMHDGSVVEFMDADFSSKSLADCLAFIESAKDDSDNLHLAIGREYVKLLSDQMFPKLLFQCRLEL